MANVISLNFEQQKAVTADPGPVLVLAGPGSGKTRVLTQRFTHLITQGIRPNVILAVTFTNRASEEMRERIQSQVDSHIVVRNVGTFHALCARILRNESDSSVVGKDFVIFDSADQRLLIKQAMVDHNVDDARYKLHRIHSTISTAKNDLVNADNFSRDSYYHEIVGRIYERYQYLLHQNNALDFDDLLMNVVSLLQTNPVLSSKYQDIYQRILVDEFQDTNLAQYQLLRLLSGSNRDLFVVGDPDQSIYRWRGADYRNVERFRADYLDTVVIQLNKNYRSTQIILDAATAVISKNHVVNRVKLYSDFHEGEKIVLHEAYDEEDESHYIVKTISDYVANNQLDPGECAVMYRTNAQSRSIEEAFVRAGMPYRLLGATRFYARREIKDLLAYMRVIYNQYDNVSLGRIINVPARGIGSKTLNKLFEYSDTLDMHPVGVILELTEQGLESQHCNAIGQRGSRALISFGLLLRDWIALFEKGEVVSDILDSVVNDIDYENYIENNRNFGADQWENVEELKRVFVGFEDRDFGEILEGIALIADVDTLDNDVAGEGVPVLMTLHAAKGLEFPVVFLVGLNDGVLPHHRSFDEPEEMAEERRLFYVGLTRAKSKIHLSYSFRRWTSGFDSSSIASRFISDIPLDLLLSKSDYIDKSNVNISSKFNMRVKSNVYNDKVYQIELQFQSGQRVIHDHFGSGIVVESKLLGSDEMVIIAFDNFGIKRLVASKANLTLEDD